jgi:phospholipid/cholesterol/gamma-HCH transport system ATP-binding protein
VIDLRGVSKRFGPKVVLHDVNLTVARGETHVVVGQSGQGKSVMLKHVCALMWPDSGEVVVDGKALRRGDRDSIRVVRERVNMLFQFGALFDSLNIRDNVGFTLQERGELSKKEINSRVAEALEMVNLTGIEDLMPADISGGMKKRVGLARALISRPQIMLYDEPNSGLDPVTSDLINDLIIKTQQQLGVTSIVVTHDMASAYKVGNHISMLASGALIATGTPDEIRAHGDPRVRQFIEGRAQGPLTDSAEE